MVWACLGLAVPELISAISDSNIPLTHIRVQPFSRSVWGLPKKVTNVKNLDGFSTVFIYQLTK